MKNSHKYTLLILFLFLEFAVLFFVMESGLRIGALAWRNIYRTINHQGDSFFIYVIGESTSYGEPFALKISFPKILSYMFDDKIGGKKVKIINLSKAGSFVEDQYWALFRELLIRPSSSGILLIYAGINESVGISTVPDPTFKRWRLMQNSLILSRLQYLLGSRLHTKFLNSFLGLENSLPKFEYRLGKIISLAKENGLNVIISTLVGNISQFSPQQFNPQESDIYQPKNLQAKELFNSGMNLENSGKLEEAIGIYKDILERFNINPSHIFYRLGKCYEKLQVYDEAKNYYWKAVDIGQGETARPNHFQNSIIKNLSEQFDIGLVDSLEIFEGRSPHGLLGYNLIIDAHHLNLDGYILLAKGFAEQLEKISGEEVKRRDVAKEEILKHFDFSQADILQVYISRAEWMCLESLTVYDKDEILKRAEYYLEKAEKIEEIPDIYFWYFFVSVLKKDRANALYWLDKGRLLTKNKYVFFKYKKGWYAGIRYFDLFKSVLPGDVLSKIAKILDDGSISHDFNILQSDTER